MSQQTLSIDLNIFPFQGKYRLSTASLAQIVIGLEKTSERLDEPKNPYQQILYPWFKVLVPQLTASFKNLLKYGSEKERMTRFYNLGGKMPKGTEVRMKYHHNVNLGNGNFGPFIEASIQRVEYVLTRKTPLRYADDQEFLDAFNKLKEDLKPFLEELKAAQKSYSEIVDKARNTVNMEKVKKSRLEKVKAHRNKKVIDKQSDSETSEKEEVSNEVSQNEVQASKETDTVVEDASATVTTKLDSTDKTEKADSTTVHASA